MDLLSSISEDFYYHEQFLRTAPWQQRVRCLASGLLQGDCEHLVHMLSTQTEGMHFCGVVSTDRIRS